MRCVCADTGVTAVEPQAQRSEQANWYAEVVRGVNRALVAESQDQFDAVGSFLAACPEEDNGQRHLIVPTNTWHSSDRLHTHLPVSCHSLAHGVSPFGLFTFIHSFICSFICSFIHSFVHSFVHGFLGL